MDTGFPYVVVPPEALEAVGQPDPGTRIYRAEGPEGASGPWFELVQDIAGPCVSPGGARMFAPVTRAAVNKRMKDGKLTAFFFYVTKERAGILFGKPRKARELAYGYVPVSELKAWAKQLEERILRLGKVTPEELEGNKPDWSDDFLQWYSDWRKEKYREAGKEIE